MLGRNLEMNCATHHKTLFASVILSLSMFFLLSSSLAQANPACETSLGRSIHTRYQQALTGSALNIYDVIHPVLEFARDHLQDFIDPRDELIIFATYRFRRAIKKDLNRLYQSQCIDHFTFKYYQAILELLKFDKAYDLLISPKISHWPNLKTYWINKDFYANRLNEKYPNPKEQEQIKILDTKLKNLYSRKIYGPGQELGKLSILDYLLISNTRPEMNLMANAFSKTLQIMSSHEAKIILNNPKLDEPIELELTPADIFRLSINYFDRELELLSLRLDKSIQMADSLLAAFLVGEIEPQALEALLTIKNFKESKTQFLKQVGQLAWSAGRIILFQHPTTLPFMTLGSILYESLERRKVYEKQETKKMQLIRE